MHRINPLAVALALAALVISLPAAAQLANPNPNQTRSSTQLAPLPPPPPPVRQIQPVRPTPAPPIPTSLGQREQAAPVQAPPQPQSANPLQKDDAQRVGAQSAVVYDRQGRPLYGMEQAGPNRVRDTRTGRYYNTVPMGVGQRIKP